MVFGGKPIVCGDESLPPYPPHLHPDTYSRTKALAEQGVLNANMAPLHRRATTSQCGGTGHLRTCVIRPAGKNCLLVYGKYARLAQLQSQHRQEAPVRASVHPALCVLNAGYRHWG